jgi:hypothetical protein
VFGLDRFIQDSGLFRWMTYSTAQRENAKTASFQGLSQRGINEKSVCIRGRSMKQHGGTVKPV